MNNSSLAPITVSVIVNAPLEKVWNSFTEPQHITGWCFASDDWCCPKAQNDLQTGGKFNTRMEAKDGSFGFDFEGIYEEVKDKEYYRYVLADNRKIEVFFSAKMDKTEVIETFDPETENSSEMQRSGWQAILDNFKKYVEEN